MCDQKSSTDSALEIHCKTHLNTDKGPTWAYLPGKARETPRSFYECKCCSHKTHLSVFTATELVPDGVETVHRDSIYRLFHALPLGRLP